MTEFDKFLKAYEEELGRETNFNEHAIAKIAWLVALKGKTDGGAEVTLDCGVIKPCPYCKGEMEVRVGADSWEGFTVIICRKQGSPFCISQWLEMTEKDIKAAWIKHRVL